MTATWSNPAVSCAVWLLAAAALVIVLLVTVKVAQLWRNAVGGRRYLHAFRQAPVLESAARLGRDSSSVGRLATVGLGILRHRRTGTRDQDAAGCGASLECHLRQEVLRERRRFGSGLAVLAIIRNGAPLVGLLGTVWGIVAVLHEAAESGATTIAAVAVPTAMALEVTGIGLVVAVAARLALHFFTRRMQRLVDDLDDFVHEFLSRAQSKAPVAAERRREITRHRPFVVVAARSAS